MPPIELTIDDGPVFRRELRVRNVSPEALITSIIHEWAISPARIPENTALPLENSVLFEDESLPCYLTRIAKATIKTVIANEGNKKKAAARLGYERSTFQKLFRRLQSKDSYHFHLNHQEPLLVGSNLSLTALTEKYVTAVLADCDGDKKRACAILQIPRNRLNSILLGIRARTNKDND